MVMLFGREQTRAGLRRVYENTGASRLDRARKIYSYISQGCTNGLHSDAVPKPDAAKPPANTNIKVTETQAGGKETFSTTLAPQQLAFSKPTSNRPVPEPEQEEEDDLDLPVTPGTKCKRNGCKTVYESDEMNRKGDGPGAICTYHPKAVGTSASALWCLAHPNNGSSV